MTRSTSWSPVGSVVAGVVVANHLTHEIRNEPDVPYDLVLTIEVIHGRALCTRVDVSQKDGGQPVIRSLLAKLPIDRWAREAAASTGWPLDGNFFDGIGDADTSRVAEALGPPRGRRGDADARKQLVETVAAMYRDLTSRGVKNPKTEIARTLGYSPSYVGALVARARSTKPPLLGPAPLPGRAGEVSPTKTRRAKRGSK